MTTVTAPSTATERTLAGQRLLPVAIPWATVPRTAIGSVAMLLAVRSIYSGRRLATVGVRAPQYI